MLPLRIVFMGTPEFAVPSLEILVSSGFHVVAVVTAPDKPQGRGQKITFSPVKECALRHHIPLFQPTNLKDPGFISELQAMQANLQIVVAFRMLPEMVWSMPEYGTFNLHASLLPQYRGAAPINWAIINGETETGVTTFFLKHEIDTGSIILQEREPIHPEDNAGTLYERLMHKGAALVLATVQQIQSGNLQSQPQPEPTVLRHAPKIFKDTCRIDWNQPAHQVVNFVRGLAPYPGAWTELNGKSFKILASHAISGKGSVAGTLTSDNKSHLHIFTSDGLVAIDELQPEGKKRMRIEEFFRGNRIT